MIKINRIEFENFRQYRKTVIDFKDNFDSNLHVLIARNGTGKTTLLNGILWCLYGVEHYLYYKDTALSIVNDSVVEMSKLNDTISVTVRLIISEEDRFVEFERSQNFIISNNIINDKKTPITGGTSFKATITFRKYDLNTVVLNGDYALNLVKQYFDESIFNYYFFDGENLKSYFEKDKANEVKNAIYNISQVTLLRNTIKHIDYIIGNKSRTANKMPNFDPSLYNKENKLKDDIQYCDSKINYLNKINDQYKKSIEDINDKLKNYIPIKSYLEQRSKYNDKLETINEKLIELKKRKNEFLREYIVLLNMFPRISKTYEMILEKERCGALPPNISKKQIKELINKNIKVCPICNNTIDDNSTQHLYNLLGKLELSSETSHRLMEIKSYLEIFLNKCMDYPKIKNKILEDERKILKDFENTKMELQKISSFLINYPNEGIDLEFNISKLESKRQEYQVKIDDNNIEIGKYTASMENYYKDLSNLKAKIDQQESNKENKEKIVKELNVYRKLKSQFEYVQNQIMLKIKNEIEKTTWNIFDSMIWKENTFARLEINDNYVFSVYNFSDKEITGSLSATERMALAYAFTLAIHRASGKNCPLVVDSPLGRVSDLNRAKMAKELLKISRDKQIIMLFTPDEYSSEVKDIYHNNVASEREILLSDDEKQIEKVG